MKTELKNICDLVKDKISVSEITTDNYISTENMLPNKCGITASSSLPKNEKVTAYRKNDILVSNIRPYFKKIWFAENSGGCSNDVLVFRAKNGISPEFLYYTLADDKFFDYAMKTSTGTKMPRGDKKAIMEYIVSVPDYETQKKAGYLLRLLDRKIELNNKINKNLEEQAFVLYQNTITNSSDTLIRTKIGDICEVKGGKRLPKGINLITKPNNHPYIRVKDLNNTCVISLNRDFEYVDDKTQKVISRYIVSVSDILISIVGTIGLTAMVHDTLNKANLTENCVKLTNINQVTPEYLLLFLRSETGQARIAKGTVGAVQLKLPIKNIQAIDIDILQVNEMKRLDRMLKPIFKHISANIEENKRLSALRDTLIPELINGEMDILKI